MIIKITSNNDYLLDILFKNPDTDSGLYFKPLKNGQIVGNAIDKHHYEVVFQDTKYSYLPEDSNQIDYQSYCSPLVVLHICNELFGHILKSREEFSVKPINWLNITQGEADTECCMIEIPSFYIDSNWFRNGRFLLTKYFEGIKIEQQSNRVFKLTVTAKSVFEAVNLLALTALLTHVTNNYSVYTYIDDQLAQKFGRILTNIDHVPYFVFYLFIMRAVKSPRQFEELKPVFESYLNRSGLKADLVLEGTYRQRIQFITSCLEKDIPVLDIGCGELTYYKKMMAQDFAATYYAIDIDPQFERLAQNISRRYENDNLIFFHSLDEFASEEQLNVLLTEVIEHNPPEEARRLIKKALSYNVNKLLITTPNQEFNQFYNMEQELRHDDHHFELTQKEFKELIEDVILDMECSEGLNVEFFYLGDCLNGIQPTQGCIITKEE
ncbi:MAG: class I SAM-dependent methyltransferase [Tannerella sp.]|jgi:SAM-dependent methyltransferase|nr:class I SAM-dependent methyltransferase [Tannerella sp.]